VVFLGYTITNIAFDLYFLTKVLDNYAVKYAVPPIRLRKNTEKVFHHPFVSIGVGVYYMVLGGIGNFLSF